MSVNCAEVGQAVIGYFWTQHEAEQACNLQLYRQLIPSWQREA